MAKKRIVISLVLVSSLMAFSLSTAPIGLAQGKTTDAATVDTAAKFVQRYLDAVASASTPKALMPYMKLRKDMPPMPEATTEEDKKMEAKMMAAFMEMQKASTPLKAEVTGSQDRDGKLLLLLKATQVAPQSKLDLKAAGASATGKMLLEKGPTGDWLVAGEYWHYVYGNGLTTDSGQDPDAAPKVASPMDKYSDDIMEALNKVWIDPAQGTGQVMVEFKNNSAGQFELLGVSDKHGSKEAESAVKEAMAKINLPPLPDQASDQPIVNIQLSWSPKSKDTMKMVQLLHTSMIVK